MLSVQSDKKFAFTFILILFEQLVAGVLEIVVVIGMIEYCINVTHRFYARCIFHFILLIINPTCEHRRLSLCFFYVCFVVNMRQKNAHYIGKGETMQFTQRNSKKSKKKKNNCYDAVRYIHRMKCYSIEIDMRRPLTVNIKTN